MHGAEASMELLGIGVCATCILEGTLSDEVAWSRG